MEVHRAGFFASVVDDTRAYAYREGVAMPDSLRQTKRSWQNLASRYGFSFPSVAIGFAALPTTVVTRLVTRLVTGMAAPEKLRQNLEWVEESNSIPDLL